MFLEALVPDRLSPYFGLVGIAWQEVLAEWLAKQSHSLHGQEAKEAEEGGGILQKHALNDLKIYSCVPPPKGSTTSQ
jgi:hypothetical protein